MAIKDLVAPGFIGTSTIEFIVTRGLGSASVSAAGGGAWRFESEDLSIPRFTVEDMSVPKFTTETIKRS
jgi:hypothetical protein